MTKQEALIKYGKALERCVAEFRKLTSDTARAALAMHEFGRDARELMPVLREMSERVALPVPPSTRGRRFVCALLGHDPRPITDYMSDQDIRDELTRTEGFITVWTRCARCGATR